jgi:two-component system sensor histidine kinase YesM
MIKQVDFYAFNVLEDYSIFNHLNQNSYMYGNSKEYIEQRLSEIVEESSSVSKISIITPDNKQFNSDHIGTNLSIEMFSEVNTLPIIIQIPNKSLTTVHNVQVRTLIDFSTGIKYGYLCIFINDSAIYDCYNGILSDSDTCMIVNSNHQIIFSDSRNSSETLLSLAIPDLNAENQNVTENMVENNTYYSKKIKINSTPTLDWYLVCSFSNQGLRKQIQNLNRIMTILQCLILLISIVILFRLSNSLTSYVRMLYHKMIGYPDVIPSESALAPKPQDEFAFLDKTLHDMISKINLLMESIETNQKKQRELELQIMQAQINPHFIYNSIDSISCLALENGQYEIRKIATYLANFFRISLSKGNKHITVADELQHVKYYIAIEQFRSNNSFNVTYDIAPDIMDKKIIKIILQPLVENSIRHGLKNKSGIGHIKITGFILDGALHFEVTDDGVGFDTDILTNSNTYEGFGYKNINDRIRLEYGDEYGLIYYSVPGKFTRAEIIMGYSESDSPDSEKLHL